MAVRDAPGNFSGTQQTSGFAVGHTLHNIDEFAANAGTADQTSGWTIGASSIAQVTSLPPLDYHATVIAYQVSARLGMHTNALETYGGKLGKIVTALQFGQYATAPNQNQNPVPLPGDSSLIATLWDPAIDGLPGDDAVNPATLLSVNVVNVLSQPVPILQQVITVGIWMTPSLMTMKAGGATVRALTLYDAVFKVTVDDGK